MMLKYGLSLILVALAVTVFAQKKEAKPFVKMGEMCWWYEQPAKKYWEGLPIATGRFAAMIGGGIDSEDIVFNDETLWSGGPYNPNNPNGPKILDSVRTCVLDKDYVKATGTALHLNSSPMSVQHYQPMGILNIFFPGQEEKRVKNYHRKLSMDSALVTVSYQMNGVDYKREIFASYPDQVIVMRITASKPRCLNLKAGLTSLQSSAQTSIVGNDIIMQGTTTELFSGRYEGHPIPAKIKWQARLKVRTEGGTVSYLKTEGKTGDLINIEEANSITLILAGATNWKSWNDVSADEIKRCNDYIQKAQVKNYTQLKSRHLADYVPLFASCKIDLCSNDNGKLNTTARMQRLKEGADDPLFISQYFQYGRYLLLAAAREGTLAFNNHNIWLNNMEGRWQGRWTLNINLQECYWPVESTNLAGLNESLLYFTEQLAQAGGRTAKELYNFNGWVAHHGTDIWFNTAPTDNNPKATVWPMGGAWLLQQLFDHYSFDPNSSYLKRLYPLMKGSVQFYMDFLITDPATGWKVTCPSISPENSFFTNKGEIATTSMGGSMDNQILRNLFRNFCTASEVLGVDTPFRNKVQQVLQKLPPHQIGSYGQLQEWIYDFKEVDPGHRHLSQLFASYPDDDITIRKTPELAKAVKIVLERRGDINKGWSGAWKINQHARMEEPEAAYKILKSMLTEISIHPREEDSGITPSFEGNQGIQGVTAGIAEMLLQSHSGEIYLLPSLPKAWSNGSIKGLRGKGGFQVDIRWEKGKLSQAALSSTLNTTCRLRSKTPVEIFVKGKAIAFCKTENDLYVFYVSKGKSYQIIAK